MHDPHYHTHLDAIADAHGHTSTLTQGVGSLLSVVVVAACLHAGSSSGFTWRFALAFGALPRWVLDLLDAFYVCLPPPTHLTLLPTV